MHNFIILSIINSSIINELESERIELKFRIWEKEALCKNNKLHKIRFNSSNYIIL